jgi:hypothetical protein
MGTQLNETFEQVGNRFGQAMGYYLWPVWAVLIIVVVVFLWRRRRGA